LPVDRLTGMTTCTVCHQAIEPEQGSLTHPDTGEQYHLLCALTGVPDEAAVWFLNLVATAASPVVAVWSG
jgi:hypothetical protein